MIQFSFRMLDLIKVPIKQAKKYSYFIIIQKVVEGIIPSLQVFIMARFIDIAMKITQNNASQGELIVPFILLVFTISYSWFSNEILTFAETKLVHKLRETLRIDITDKCSRLKYKYVENDDSQNLISRVLKEPENEFKNGFRNILNLCSLTIRVLGIVAIIMFKVWWCGIIILIFNIPLVYLSIKNGKVTYKAVKDVTYNMRRYEYLSEILVGRDAAAERNIFGYTDYINGMWYEQYEISRKKQIKAFISYFSKIKIYGILTTLIAVCMIGLLIEPTLSGSMSIGLYMSLVTNLLMIVRISTQQLTFELKEFAKKKEFLSDLKEFYLLEEEEDVLTVPSDSIEVTSVELINVSFKYPNTDRYVLKDISLILEKGKHYAFVGENGAGKTTITKLLTGLYDNYEGEIRVNGTSLRKYKQREIKALCSVVYQDFAKYPIRISDNILLGDIALLDSDMKAKRVKNILEQIKLNKVVEDLPEKANTVLGKLDENDVELSLGQWQRIAIARALINNAPIRILDEPTASLDPISERNIYREYEELSKNNITIFISHRLGATRLADEIIVFDSGRIIEKGLHDELMMKEGIYSLMYENQRSWYV